MLRIGWVANLPSLSILEVMEMVSERLRVAVKLSPKKDYQIAHEANLHPSTLSKLINGIERAKPGDERVLRIARVVGIPADECFTETT